MDEIKVSVLTPAYNAEKWIGEAVESILNQTFSDWEFIIIDDGSTDKTWEIIQAYAKKDRRITCHQNEENLGIYRTRNKLILLSKGKYIAWQDADDISLSHRLRRQYDYMEEHPEVGKSGGYLQYFDERGNRGVRKYAEDDTTLRKKIFRYSPVAQPAAIIRRESLDRTGLFPLASPVAEDLAMSFQIGTKYKFGNIPEVLVRYREVASGATFSKLRVIEMYTMFLRIRYANTEYYKMSFFDKFYNAMQYIFLFLIPPKLTVRLFNYLRNSNFGVKRANLLFFCVGCENLLYL